MTASDRRSATAQVLLDDGAGAGLADTTIGLADDVEHHLRRVLRIRDGESVVVTDGRGRWRMTLARVSGSSLWLEPIGEVGREPAPDSFTLATAIPKGDRLDWLVQKTVELGVSRLVLLDAERSTVRWKGERVDRQLARVRRIADEATRQSRRVWRAEIDGPVPAASVLVDAAVAEVGAANVPADEPIIAIGPEGGWSQSELDLAPRRVGLGANVLRVETAAIAATTLRMIR